MHRPGVPVGSRIGRKALATRGYTVIYLRATGTPWPAVAGAVGRSQRMCQRYRLWLQRAAPRLAASAAAGVPIERCHFHARQIPFAPMPDSRRERAQRAVLAAHEPAGEPAPLPWETYDPDTLALAAVKQEIRALERLRGLRAALDRPRPAGEP
jgi:hypothetical protein